MVSAAAYQAKGSESGSMAKLNRGEWRIEKWRGIWRGWRYRKYKMLSRRKQRRWPCNTGGKASASMAAPAGGSGNGRLLASASGLSKPAA